jgi:TolB-like protein/DNA-binding winged helix-turn-helix (wHTH) protein/Tfp pilus assembly protein PilF
MRDLPRPTESVRFRFGVFELDARTGELRKAGVRVRLAGQPLRLLERLLDRPGDLVTREELRQELWSEDTFVDFEHNLNSAIKRLRAALGDSAETPRFIETLPRRGYRFLAPIERIPLPPPDGVDRPQPADAPSPGASINQPAPEMPQNLPAPGRIRRVGWLAAATMLVMIAAGALGYSAWRDRQPSVRAIAVLPFVLANPASTEDEYIAFGMSEALITELSKLSGLRVISQTSSMQYKNAAKSLPAIAGELGVDAVVEGSVQREGNRIRITVQLIEAATDGHLWADNYERDIGGVLTLVDEVARTVAERIHVQVAPPDALRSASKALDPRVIDAYMKGRYHLGRGNETDFVRAVGYFERALTIDPSHAPSHAGLADYYIVTDSVSPEIATGKARFHAAKALELDDRLPDAHASLAFLHFYYDWDWEAAEREFRRALDLDPGHKNAHRWYGLFLSAMGRHAEALGQIQTALKADPISIGNHDAAATIRFNARQYAATEARGHDIHGLNRFDARGYEHIAMGLMQQQRVADALAQVEQGLQLAQSNIALELIRLACLTRLGRTSEADEALAAFERNAQRGYVPGVVLAVAYAELQRHTQALDWLEQAYDKRDPYLVLINVSPWFDSLRDEERFRRLSDRLQFRVEASPVAPKTPSD